MDSAVRLLDHDLLLSLEDHWRTQGAPIMGRLRPGLTDEAMDAAMASLGLALPQEARTWWGWHDGAEPDPGKPWHAFIGPVVHEYLSLQSAIDTYRKMRRLAIDVTNDATPEERREAWADPNTTWHPSWFPVLAPEWVIACDCSTRPGAPTPIRAVDHSGDSTGYMKVKARSLGELVSWWIEAMDVGAWRFDPSRDRWLRDWELLDYPNERGWLV